MRAFSFALLVTLLFVQVPAFSDIGSCDVRLVSFKHPSIESRYTHCSAEYPCPSPDDFLYSGPREVTFDYIVGKNEKYKEVLNTGNQFGSLYEYLISKEGIAKTQRTFGLLWYQKLKGSEIKYKYQGERPRNEFLWDDGKRYQTIVTVYSHDTSSIDVPGVLWGDKKPPQEHFGVFVRIADYDKKKEKYTSDSSGYLNILCR